MNKVKNGNATLSKAHVVAVRIEDGDYINHSNNCDETAYNNKGEKDVVSINKKTGSVDKIKITNPIHSEDVDFPVLDIYVEKGYFDDMNLDKSCLDENNDTKTHFTISKNQVLKEFQTWLGSDGFIEYDMGENGNAKIDNIADFYYSLINFDSYHLSYFCDNLLEENYPDFGFCEGAWDFVSIHDDYQQTFKEHAYMLRI
jgi:hypothetical protein